MRILVTGATGFIGSHLVPKLLERGHDVHTLVRYVTGRYFQGPDQNERSVFCDLRDHLALCRFVRELQPEVTIHLGAVTPGAYSYGHAEEVLETNFLSTVNLAEACCRDVSGFRQFLFASSSETYGNGPVPRTEEALQSPHSPYAVAKLSCERYLQYMYKAYGFPVTILRPFNTYGRKENYHFVVESAIVQMLRGHDVQMGDPKPVRDFIYVDDHVDAYLRCLAKDAAIGEVFNFCSGKGISILELLQKLCKITGYRGNVRWNSVPKRPLDIEVLFGDCSKATEMLGWKVHVDIDTGLELAVDFWRRKLSMENSLVVG